MERWLGGSGDKLCTTLRSLCEVEELNVNKQNCKAKCTQILNTSIALRPKQPHDAVGRVVDAMIPVYGADEIPGIVADVIGGTSGAEALAFKPYIEECCNIAENPNKTHTNVEDAHLRKLIGRAMLKRKRDT